MAFDAKEFVKNAVIPAAAINTGGYAFKYIDPVLTPYYNKLNSTSMPTASKWAKVATYTGAGLAIQAAMDFFKVDGMTKEVGDAAGMFLYGLSSATIAADPTYIVPQVGASTRVISQQPAGISTTPNFTTPSVVAVAQVPTAIM